MKNRVNPIMWVALAFGAQCAMAGSMMCGETVIQDGELVPMTSDQVLAACGEPTTREPGEWVYEQPSGLDKILRFDDAGNLQSISVQVEGD